MAIDCLHARQKRVVRTGVSVLGALGCREDAAPGEFSDVDQGGGDDAVEEFFLTRFQGCEMPEYGKDFDEFPAPIGLPALRALPVEITAYFAGGAVASVSEPAVEYVAP
ncbi:hypothetical protein, partial [Streptomyces sp. 4F14]|uniref:hypothetical protein n=1 Tax=Streptomyces sp. 4F14 TaxID=3394380 RepID=UPI003A888F18